MVHVGFDKTNIWLESQGGGFDARNSVREKILGVHIRFAIFRENGENDMQQVSNLNYEADMKGYFEMWPKIFKGMKELDPPGFWGPQSEELLFDMWVSLLFRACCWGACHVFVPGERVPSSYWDSRLPVYIG